MELESSSVEERKRRRHGEKPGRQITGENQRRVRLRVHGRCSPIQRLFLGCRSVFKGPGSVPSPLDVDKIRFLLDTMSLEDVGLCSDMLPFKSRSSSNGTPRITYKTAYKCDNFSLCILLLPPGAVIPLHNHPGMTVLSKLLVGSMHIKAYDWVDPVRVVDSEAPSTKLRLARLVVDSVFAAPCKSSILFPTTGGNIHTFVASTSCVVLDVLGPPYLNEDGRDCTYYKEHPYCHVQNGTSAGKS
ncbi:Cysteine oxygenase/2-aminoethanethiol dioxygenase protein [Dioscorea alata]|uniref:Cysteine oxygenase/2-aminoethanethiol dioxygenase protein n=2 Tax=Dioscorea alata TaxID=55571 RepID=A0ACB7UME6_DIOAL|nr:Cysteine oxygenase/2-aminoethanethiol dioxygenase protein [Dioscorea alata]